jgi:hypothetical protein
VGKSYNCYKQISVLYRGYNCNVQINVKRSICIPYGKVWSLKPVREAMRGVLCAVYLSTAGVQLNVTIKTLKVWSTQIVKYKLPQVFLPLILMALAFAGHILDLWPRSEIVNWYYHKLTSLQSPSHENNRPSTSEEIPHFLWNKTLHYHIQKSQPLVPILRQVKPVYMPCCYQLRLGLSPSVLSISGY